MAKLLAFPQPAPTLRVGVLGSTRGTALQGILNALAANQLPHVALTLVVSDKPDAPILDRAANAGIDTLFLDPHGLDRPIYDEELSRAFDEAGADLLLLIGYMRLLSSNFLEQWRGRLLNVHPSLLPAFAGLINRRVHEAVLHSGATETGCTVHHVTEDLDAGPIVLQLRCPVLESDTVETLKDRVQTLEQQAFVQLLQTWPNTAST